MAFCANCGAQVMDGAKFCPGCGATMSAPEAQAAAAQYEQTQYQYDQQAQYQQQQQGYVPPVMPGAPPQADIRDAQENKTMSWLAYILFFIPLLTGAHKTSPFAKFHTNQGTVLAISAVIWSIAYTILSIVLAFIPVIGWILIILIGVASFIFPIFCIIGIINAVNGRMKPLPIIGKFTIIK